MATTNHADVVSATNEKIVLGAFNKGISHSALAKKAGIPTSTFHRKLHKNPGDFTLRELGQIAEALELGLGDILPMRDAA